MLPNQETSISLPKMIRLVTADGIALTYLVSTISGIFEDANDTTLKLRQHNVPDLRHIIFKNKADRDKAVALLYTFFDVVTP
jgi:hypothetical protein